MNPFASLQNDTVYIEDSGGARSGPYKTAIGSKGGLAAFFEAALEVGKRAKRETNSPATKRQRRVLYDP